MQKYIDNYGNEIYLDEFVTLPIDNNRQDTQSEELWRRLFQVYSGLKSSQAKKLLRELLEDIEHWMERNPMESPERWDPNLSESGLIKNDIRNRYLDNEGNQIEADYGTLPVANNKGDMMYEELWRRIQYIESLIRERLDRERLQDILMDLEYWLSDDPILSPLRWDLEKDEWEEEQEARIKKRQELDGLIAIEDKSAIANFYRKNGVWYSTKKLIGD